MRVELPAEDDVLALPQTALVTSLYGDFIYVVRPAGRPHQAAEAAAQAAPQAAKPAPRRAEPDEAAQLVATQVFVKPGRRNEGLVEITEGLRPATRWSRRARTGFQRRAGHGRQHDRPDEAGAQPRRPQQ